MSTGSCCHMMIPLAGYLVEYQVAVWFYISLEGRKYKVNRFVAMNTAGGTEYRYLLPVCTSSAHVLGAILIYHSHVCSGNHLPVYR